MRASVMVLSFGVVRQGLHLGDQCLQAAVRCIKAHFGRVLDWVGRLVFQTGGAFVPEHALALVEGHIAQTHGVGRGEPASKRQCSRGHLEIAI